MNINYNDLTISGKINYISDNKTYTYISLECNNYSKDKSKVFLSLRVYKDLYEKYKDLFYLDNFIYLKGYINSYKDSKGNIQVFIVGTFFYSNADDLDRGITGPHIRYDTDGVMVWNGKRCEKVPASKEEQEEMQRLIDGIVGDTNE